MIELLQQRYAYDPWRVGVCCILLNQTTRTQVDRVIERVFAKYRTASEMARASLAELRAMIDTTGMGWTKAYRLIRFSHEYFWEVAGRQLEGRIHEQASALYGVGPYAVDSIAIFCDDVPRCESGDKELVKYLEQLREAEAT